MKIILLVPQWAHAHQVPVEAITNQIYTAHAWADSNPLKAPKKNMTRFLWSWMASAKRYGNLRVPEKKVAREPDVENYEMTFEEMVAIRQQNMRRQSV